MSEGRSLASGLCEALPAYAVPVFLRLRTEHDTTGTFKYRKVELKTEGFDPVAVSEPIYVLLDRETGYERLTTQMVDDIASGRVRL